MDTLIQNELHSVNESRYKDYYFIVPFKSPFIIDDFTLDVTINNVTTRLNEDVDYSFALEYVTGTRTVGKACYGAITLHNLNINGILSINYRPLDSTYEFDRLNLLTLLSERAYNPRTTIWDILDVPSIYAPVPHYQDYDTFFGQEALITALSEIRDAILQNSSVTSENLTEFLNTINSGLLGSYLLKTGDTMLGKLILIGNPTDENEAATKKYVDENTVDMSELTSYMSQYHNAEYINQQLDTKVNKSGDIMSGPLSLSGDPVEEEHAVNKRYLEVLRNNLQTQINDINNILGNLSIGHVTQEYVDSRINELIGYIDSIAMNK